MSYLHIEEEPSSSRVGVPKFTLILALALALIVIALAATARLTRSHTGALGEQTTASIVTSRSLVFSDLPNGNIAVYDVQHEQQLPPLTNTGGFVRGALRALARQRKLAGVGPEVPFALTRWSDGRLTLDDSATSNHLELRAYGSANEADFAALIAPSPAAVAVH
ncbi:MAG: photosynthetic complex assembly protein PuhC [Gemmatimonadota bacterium]